MKGCIRGISTPSFKQAVVSKGKKPMENDKEPSKGKERSNEEEQEGTKAREHNEALENVEDIREKSTKDKAHMGPCKPKVAVIPRII